MTGTHDWLWPAIDRTFTYPKRGPYDFRTDEQRTFTKRINICAQCGKERDFSDDNSLTIPT